MRPCEQCGTPTAATYCRDCLEWAAMERRLQAFAAGIAQRQHQHQRVEHQGQKAQCPPMVAA